MADSKFDKWGRAARDLFVKHGRTLEEISDLLDISRKSIGEWSAAGNWVKLRKQHAMRPAELAEFAEDILYSKMEQLRDLPPEQIDSGLLDGLGKLMKQAKDLKRNTGLLNRAADVLDYYVEFLREDLPDLDRRSAECDRISRFLLRLETIV